MARGSWGSIGDPRIFRIRISWMQGLTKAQTGFHLRAAAAEIGDPENAATVVAAWVNAQFRNLLFDNDTLESVDAVNIADAEGFTHAFANVHGTIPAGSNALPGFIQCTVGLKGELRRRWGQGRMLWPVRSEGFTDGDVLNAAGLLAFNTVVTDFADRFVGSNLSGEYVAVNAHDAYPERTNPKTGKVRPALPRMYYDVTAAKLNTAVSMVESRKAGRGS